MSGTNRNRPWDKWDPSPGQSGTRHPSLRQTGLSLFNSTVKSPFCPVCPWDGWGFVPGTIVPQGPAEKCLCVFCLLVFSLPNFWRPSVMSLKKKEAPTTSKRGIGEHALQYVSSPPPSRDTSCPPPPGQPLPNQPPVLSQKYCRTTVRQEKGTRSQTFWSGYFRVGWGSSM